MQTEESRAVIGRFFEAFAELKARGVIRNDSEFAARCGINRGTFSHSRRDHSSDRFQAAWLGRLVRDYGVSAAWLLTGEGEMTGRGPAESGASGKTPSRGRR